MSLPTWYSAGKVSVESESTTVTLTGGYWGDDNIMPGDLFCDPAQPLVPPQRVKSVTADDELELWAPWPGASVEGGDYEIRYVGIVERSTAQTRRVLEQLGDVKAWYDVIVEDDDERLALETATNPLRAGHRVLVKDDGVIWAKETSAFGNWIGPVEFKGDTGNKGWSPQLVAEADGDRRVLKLSGYVGGEGDPPTVNVGQYLQADGTWTSTIGDAVDFRGQGIVFVGEYNDEANYGAGNIARDNGSAWITLQPTTGNTPPGYPATSNAYWALLAVKGQDGTGTGDVVGPSSSVDNGFVVFSGTTGKLIKARTAAEVTASLRSVVGDSGSGGTKGLVPAPAAGDAAARKFLSADGTWAPLSVDELEFTVSQLALGMADALNVAQFLGPSGNRFADSFDTLTYVDVAGATNLDISTVGVLKATVSAAIDQTATHTSANSSGTIVSASTFSPAAKAYAPWNAFDKIVGVADNNSWATNGLQNGWIQYQFAIAKKVGSYTVRSTNTTPSRAPRDWTLLGSNTGAFAGEQVTLDAQNGQAAWSSSGQVRTFSIASPGTFLYYRLNVTANNGDAYLQIDEIALLDVVVSRDLAVQSAAFVTSEPPHSMKSVLNVREVEAAVAGADYFIDVSRDDGATWSAMTLTERYSLPSGLRVLEGAETDMSGQPAGVSPRWRFRTLNNKNVELHDVYLYWK